MGRHNLVCMITAPGNGNKQSSPSSLHGEEGWGLVLSRVSASVCELSMMIQCFFFGLFLCLHG